MSSKCELSGVCVQYGNKVSHSQRKTRRRFEPNTADKTFISNITGQRYKIKISKSCLRTMDKHGGFDEFMLNYSANNFSERAMTIRKAIMDKIVGEAK